MLRRTIAGTLVFLGVVALNLGAVGWWFDREVADPERISELAAAVSRSPEFQNAVASELTTHLIETAEGTPASQFEGTDVDAIATAAAKAMDDNEVLAAVKAGVADAYRAATDLNIDQFSFDLAPLKAGLVSTLEPVDPELADRVARTDVTQEAVSVGTEDLPDVGLVAERLHLAWMLQLSVGALAIGGALLIHPRRFVVVRRVGLLMAVGAGLQLALTYGLTAAADRFGPDEGLFVGVSVALDWLMASLRIQAYLQLGAAAFVAVGGHVLVWTRRLVPGLVPRLA